MNLRRLLGGSALYGIGNLLPRAAALLLLPVYTAAMAPAEFGVFSLMLSLTGLLAIVVRLGLDGALLRLHFDTSAARRPSLYLSLAACTALAALAFSAILTLVGGPLFAVAFPGVAFVPFGVLALAITATTAFGYVPSSLYRATERPDRFLAFSAASLLLGVVGTLIFVVGFGMGTTGALLGQLVAGVGVVLITVGVLARLRRPRVDRALVRAGLGFGLPLVPHALAGWVLNLSDRWLIGLLIGLPVVAAQAAIGVYSFGYLVGQLVGLVAISFNAAWVPFFYAHGDGQRGPAILRETSTLAVGGLAVLAGGIGLLGPELTDLLARARWGAEAHVAAEVMTLVAVASLVQGLYFLLVAPIFLHKRTRILPLLTLVAAAANLGANLLLIPRLGILGAAWATLVGYGVLALLTWWSSSRHYPLRIDGVRLAVIGTLLVTAVLLGRWLAPAEGGLLSRGLVHLAVSAGLALALVPVLRAPLARLRELLGALDTMDRPKEHA